MKTLTSLHRNHICRIGWLIVLCVTVFCALMFLVPYNDDEFIHYHIIRCWFYPASNTNFQLCNDMALSLFGTSFTLPLRVYHYVGSVGIFYYLPIFAIFPYPITVRIVGLAFLLLEAWIWSSVHKISWVVLSIFLLLLFPYVYQHVIDTGPVGQQILILLVIYFLAEQWLKQPKVWQSYLLTTLVFMGIWSKLTFFWYGPILVTIAVRMLLVQRKKISVKFALRHLAGPATLLIVLLTCLFTATVPGNPKIYPYVDQVQGNNSYTFSQMLQGEWTESKLLDAMSNPIQAGQRSFLIGRAGIPEITYSLLLYLSPFVILIACLQIKNGAVRRHLRHALAAYSLFFVTMIIVLSSKRAWSMHHFILVYPPLITTYLFIYQALYELVARKKMQFKILRRGLIMMGCLLCISFAYFYFMLIHANVYPFDDPSKMKINRILNDDALAKNYVYVVMDWGMIFYQGLYGPTNQAVLWNLNRGHETLPPLQKLSREMDRKLLFIFMKQNRHIEGVRKHIPGLVTCCVSSECTGWNVSAEPSPLLLQAFPFCR